VNIRGARGGAPRSSVDTRSNGDRGANSKRGVDAVLRFAGNRAQSSSSSSGGRALLPPSSCSWQRIDRLRLYLSSPARPPPARLQTGIAADGLGNAHRTARSVFISRGGRPRKGGPRFGGALTRKGRIVVPGALMNAACVAGYGSRRNRTGLGCAHASCPDPPGE
jgi:hypothetical protein